MKKGFLDGRIITEAKEQKELLASLKEKQDFVLIVQELQKYQDFNVDNLVVSVALEGDQINFDGKLTNVKAVTFKNPEKTVSISYVKVDDFEQVHESFTGKVVQEQIYKGFKAKLGEVLPTFTKEYNGELETEPKLTTSRITLITLRAKQLEVRLWIGLMVNYAWKMKMPVELTDTVVRLRRWYVTRWWNSN